MKRNNNILIVEDESNLGDSLLAFLRTRFKNVELATSLMSAKTKLNEHSFELALLDIGLPDGSGLELGEYIRQQKPKMEILFLSAQNDPETKVQGLDLGAIDFISKPFDLKELEIRLSRILKEEVASTLELPNISISFEGFYIQTPSNKVDLSSKEAAILKLLYEHRNKAVSRDQILNEIWGSQFPTNRTIDNYIVKLRKIVEEYPKDLQIHSIRGVGYKMEISND